MYITQTYDLYASEYIFEKNINIFCISFSSLYSPYWKGQPFSSTLLMGAELRSSPLNIPSIPVVWCSWAFSEALNLIPMMPRDGSLSSSCIRWIIVVLFSVRENYCLNNGTFKLVLAIIENWLISRVFSQE